jgi:ABC-type multidrug transport system ATPase subunit
MDIIFDQVNKNFGNKKVINNFSYTFKDKSYAIIGDNGSGKTTFLKLISTLIAPSSGKINFYYQNNLLTNELAIKNISFAAPYQELIEEMDINTLLRFHFKFKIPLIENDKLIKKMGLYDYKKNKSTNYLLELNKG